MKNPNNILIRTSRATDEELAGFNAWCEVCGTKDVYANMIHDFEIGTICCNTEGCYSQIKNKKEKEMKEFTMEGFNHVEAGGIIAFWQLLQQQGTIDLLWDMQPKTKINALMQSSDFDMDAHIKTNYVGQDYDNICAEMLDEMLETIITLEYCFIYDVYNIDFNGRTFKNLDSILESTVWSPNVYPPITAGSIINSMEELTDYCMNTLTCDSGIGEVNVCVIADIDADTSSDGQESQSFNWCITGAGDNNTLSDIVESLEDYGYVVTFKLI